MKIIKGNLFEQGFPAMAHGCNMQGAMGAGIARSFKQLYPQMYMAYRAHCVQGNARAGMSYDWYPKDGPYIYNLFTQDEPGPYARLGWLATSLYRVMLLDYDEIDQIGVPMIGAGIGGLEPESVLQIFRDVQLLVPEVELVVCQL